LVLANASVPDRPCSAEALDELDELDDDDPGFDDDADAPAEPEAEELAEPDEPPQATSSSRLAAPTTGRVRRTIAGVPHMRLDPVRPAGCLKGRTARRRGPALRDPTAPLIQQVKSFGRIRRSSSGW
jgi:hypothetical protein